MNPTTFARSLTDAELQDEISELEQSQRFNAFYRALCVEFQERYERAAREVRRVAA